MLRLSRGKNGSAEVARSTSGTSAMPPSESLLIERESSSRPPSATARLEPLDEIGHVLTTEELRHKSHPSGR